VNTNVEELLRDGMGRFAAGVAAPDGLAATAVRRHRRRVAIRAGAVGGGIAAAAAVAVLLTGVTGATARATSPTQARDIVYVTRKVESALSGQNLVSVETTSMLGHKMVTWTYGDYWNWVQFNPTTDYRWVADGKQQWSFPPADRGKPATAQGTALVSGKLMGAYVTYNNDSYSLSSPGDPDSGLPTSACSTTARLAMGGIAVPGVSWSQFINNTLRCGTASVTGHVRINGHETTQITGKPVTVRLSASYAKVVREKWATVRWTMYVNPKTYLPVRMYGSTQTYGGQAGNQVSSGVTNMTWLQPTPANIAKALVTIPTGFRLYTGSPASQYSPGT
jgi:hypothetical protein